MTQPCGFKVANALLNPCSVVGIADTNSIAVPDLLRSVWPPDLTLVLRSRVLTAELSLLATAAARWGCLVVLPPSARPGCQRCRPRLGSVVIAVRGHQLRSRVKEVNMGWVCFPLWVGANRS